MLIFMIRLRSGLTLQFDIIMELIDKKKTLDLFTRRIYGKYQWIHEVISSGRRQEILDYLLT